MLSRLWRWAVPKQATGKTVAAQRPSETRARSEPQPAQLNSAAAVDNHNAAPAPTFLDQLAHEQSLTLPLSVEDEAAISMLVLQLVDYVTQKKIDPPVVPALVPRVLAIVDEPEVDLVKLTHVIQQDLAISAKLLSVANSPLFGTGVEVKTVRQAITQLGTEQVAQIAIGLACKSNMESSAALSSPFGARWQRLFHHAMTCAFASAQLVGKGDRAAQEGAFLGGLFHDVGKAVALRALEALSAQGKLNRADAPLDDTIIDEALHRLHAYPGDEFYQKWTLPESLMQLCAHHHQLEDVVDRDPTFYLVSLTSSFDALMRGDAASRREALAEARLCAEQLELGEAALRTAYNETRILGERTARLFSH